mmetsp:Transcript_55312/g.59925  ORF Transcript_55312/g.59925 Transcript_55312/m.59925 type:complete len:95 (-) Transcript_55312:99-383(-)
MESHLTSIDQSEKQWLVAAAAISRVDPLENPTEPSLLPYSLFGKRDQLLSSLVEKIVTPSSSSLQRVHGVQKRLTFSSRVSCVTCSLIVAFPKS